ncbi:hypothetical protein GC176_12990 [bacterium]|nr:hypothetical protein [bacterium]
MPSSDRRRDEPRSETRAEFRRNVEAADFVSIRRLCATGSASE